MKKFENGDFKIMEDVIFKEVFGRPKRKEFAKYLLECLLNLPMDSIKIEELNVWRDATLEKISFDQKEFQADVVMEYHEVIYNLEAFTYFGNKGLTKTISYNSRLLSSQLDRGMDYHEVKKVIQFVLLDQVEMKLNQKVISQNFMEEDSIKLSDLQEIVVIRLDKLEKLKYNVGENDKRLLLLLYFLKAKNQQEREKIGKEGDYMLKKINEFIKNFMKSKRAKENYMKHSSSWQFAEEHGKYVGRKEGISIGRDEGISIGRDEGISIGNRKFAKYLQSTGKDIEEIALTMELPVSEIQKLLI